MPNTYIYLCQYPNPHDFFLTIYRNKRLYGYDLQGVFWLDTYVLKTCEIISQDIFNPNLAHLLATYQNEFGGGNTTFVINDESMLKKILRGEV